MADQATPQWLARNNIIVVCPFCGSGDTAIGALDRNSHHWIECKSCGAKGPVFKQNCPTPSHEYDPENKPYLVPDQLVLGAKEKWNTRVSLSAHRATSHDEPIPEFEWYKKRHELNAERKNVNCDKCVNSCPDCCFECGALNDFINFND